MLDRARRGAAHRRGDLGRAALGKHDSGATAHLGHPAHGPQVVRILHLVEAENERVVGLEQPVRVGVRICLDLRADSLVVGRAAALLDLVGARRSAPRPRRARPHGPRAPWRTPAAPGACRGAPPARDCGRRRSRASRRPHSFGTSWAPPGVSRTSQPCSASCSRIRSARAKSRAGASLLALVERAGGPHPAPPRPALRAGPRGRARTASRLAARGPAPRRRPCAGFPRRSSRTGWRGRPAC